MFVAQAIANFMRQRRSLSVAPADVPTPSTSTTSHEPAFSHDAEGNRSDDAVPSTSFFGNLDDKLNNLSTAEINATSVRKLSFDGIDGILHEEPDVEESPNTISPPSGYPFVPKKTVKFIDKTPPVHARLAARSRHSRRNPCYVA